MPATAVARVVLPTGDSIRGGLAAQRLPHVDAKGLEARRRTGATVGPVAVCPEVQGADGLEADERIPA